MHRPVSVAHTLAHSSFIEGLHMTKNTGKNTASELLMLVVERFKRQLIEEHILDTNAEKQFA